MKSRRYYLTYSAVERNVLLQFLCVITFGQVVLVASSSNNQRDNAESSSLFLTPANGSILLSWPFIGRKNCNASGLESYKVAWYSDGKTRGERDGTGCGEHLLKEKLKPCTTYKITVILQDTNKTTLKNTTTTHAKVPPAIDKLSTHTIFPRSLALSWQRPTTACEITAYNITYSGVAKWKPHTEHTGNATIGREEANSATSVDIGGLQPYTDYTFKVAAYNEAGEGQWALINSTTLEGRPSKLRTLTTSSKALNTITATWSEPEHSNGVLGQYNISWHREMQTVGHTLVNITLFHIVGLSPCVEYRVRVAATTGAGEGEYNEVNQTVMKASAVPTPSSCGTEARGGTLTMTWTKPESACSISRYEVSWTRADGTTHTKVVPSDNSAVYNFSSKDFKSQGQVCVAAEVEEKMGAQGCCSYGPGGKERSKAGVTIAVSVSIPFIVIIIIIVAVVLIRKRKRKPQKETRRMGSLSSLTSIEQEFYSTLWANMKGNLELLKDNTILAAEFERLNKDSFVGEITAGLIPANRLKNRYNNMVPFDESRVLLRKDGKDAEDYINASYVKSSVEDDVNFIACQGPLSTTVSDFWWMVWEQNVSTIVMLLNNNEGGKSKCFQYWPELNEILFSPFIIMLKSKEIEYGLIRRELLLKKGTEDRIIRHFQFVSWPDFGVPNNENELLTLVGDVRRAIKPKESYVVVHCSAGVGRTGTFIALWQLQVQAERQLPDINLRRTVLELRNYRQMLVQKPAQYHYLHVCFIAYLEDIKRWRKPQGHTKSAKQALLSKSTNKSTLNLLELHARAGTPSQVNILSSTRDFKDSDSSSLRMELSQPENIALIERSPPGAMIAPGNVSSASTPRQDDPTPLSPAAEGKPRVTHTVVGKNGCQNDFPIEKDMISHVSLPFHSGALDAVATNEETFDDVANNHETLDAVAANDETRPGSPSALNNPIYYVNKFADETKVLL